MDIPARNDDGGRFTYSGEVGGAGLAYLKSSKFSGSWISSLTDHFRGGFLTPKTIPQDPDQAEFGRERGGFGG